MPSPSPRFVRLAAVVLAVLATAFALYQLFVAGVALRVHNYPFALLYAVMGIGGLAVAQALWRAYRRR